MGRLFRYYLAPFLVLWLLAKAVLAAGAVNAGLHPLAFRAYAETWACTLEVIVLAHFIRRRGEDVLLGNLGLGLGDAMLPFAPLHFVLSASLAFSAP